MGRSCRYSSRDPSPRYPNLTEGPMRSVKPANATMAVTCLVLFLLPFAVVGTVTAVLAVQRAASGSWQEALFFGLFALTFGGVGFAGIAAGLAGRRKLKEQAVLEAKYPDQPWLWRPDWASGRMVD